MAKKINDKENVSALNYEVLNLIQLRIKLKNLRKNILKVENVLTREKRIINEKIYQLGEYCLINICSVIFDAKYVYRIIEDIEKHQNVYDKYCKENAMYREVEDITIQNINAICKRLGIENE